MFDLLSNDCDLSKFARFKFGTTGRLEGNKEDFILCWSRELLRRDSGNARDDCRELSAVFLPDMAEFLLLKFSFETNFLLIT